jgi:hypothetical protein
VRSELRVGHASELRIGEVDSGDPQALQVGPDADVIRAAGAPKAAAALTS